MKKTKDLVDAEAAFAAKTGEILAARLHMKRLEIELSESCAAVQKAQADADASLPHCRIVRVRLYGGIESYGYNAVIVRRTPSGMLVVRRIGEKDEYRFRWRAQSQKFVKVGNFFNIELSDVPAEYLPNCQAA